ncbi:MAG: Unknown protein [uncultured Aureispira sp.]|uniref:Uncharacterized protein n=1 Tax=uncultured Aureispira sp. TaxID=1331704 RepID=A0A6S6RTV5_9BACT|nr:MAG: Unknown protein [uncultured Aureispira sp.]
MAAILKVLPIEVFFYKKILSNKKNASIGYFDATKVGEGHPIGAVVVNTAKI